MDTAADKSGGMPAAPRGVPDAMEECPPWQPCVASESTVTFKKTTVRARVHPIRALTRRSFRTAEQPVCRVDHDGRAVGPRGCVLTNAGDTELFGAELSVIFTPDGHRVMSGSDMGIVKIWDDQDPDKIRLLKGHYTGWVSTIVLAISPDGRRLITGGEDGQIKIWHLVNFEVITLAGLDKCVHSVTTQPDGLGIAFGLSDGALGLWIWENPSRAQEICLLQVHEKWLHALAFSPDGSCLATGAGDGTLRVWRWDREGYRVQVDTLELPVTDIYSLSFSANGQCLALGLSGGYVGLLTPADRKLQLLQADTGSIRAVAVSPLDDTVAIGLSEGGLSFWDWRHNRRRTFPAHNGTVWALAFSPDGYRLVSGGSDESLRVWMLDQPPALTEPHGTHSAERLR